MLVPPGQNLLGGAQHATLHGGPVETQIVQPVEYQRET